ncbi:MAG: hypothetical protein O7F15_08485 [Gammaproteobacteria bacterium]|jgi:hypothetical protein|nr:hypothetical protein [Gammaproteobacteria bacterium]
MSDKLFEVAFSGKISDGANLDEVKARLGGMFKADGSQLAQLFSGKRVVIKKNIDKQAAIKIYSALKRAGAECEVKPLASNSKVAVNPSPKPEAASSVPSKPPSRPAATPVRAAVPASANLEDAPPPNTDPLGITADQIEDLAATVAPVGSEMQDEIKQVAAPPIDISDLDVAPVGATIGSGKKEPDPPPPDTSGISMSDN